MPFHPSHRTILVAALLAAVWALSACAGPASNQSGASQAVESYLNALVAKDANRLVAVSCAKWEENARMELDSFEAVTATLKDVSCQAQGSDGADTLVACKGSIQATYNGENQQLDLSKRIYRVSQEGGDWRVCGYK